MTWEGEPVSLTVTEFLLLEALAARPGVIVMIGAAPNTQWLSGLVGTDAKGFVRTGAEVGRETPYETGTDGIFAVGDVRSGSVKRVASAVGEGSVVVSRIWDYVDRLPAPASAV